MTPLADIINREIDDPSVTIHLPVRLAETLIQLVGGERVSEGAGRWTFPDGFWTWCDDEALRYALYATPDVLDIA